MHANNRCVRRFDESYDDDTSGGYRDLNLNVEVVSRSQVDGFVPRLQRVNLKIDGDLNLNVEVVFRSDVDGFVLKPQHVDLRIDRDLSLNVEIVSRSKFDGFVPQPQHAGFRTDRDLSLQGYLAPHKTPTPLGPPRGRRHRRTVGSYGRAFSYERGTPANAPFPPFGVIVEHP
jgi:hypothetical protein